MLKRSLRLTSSQDFNDIYRRGIRFSTPNLLFFYLKKPGIRNKNLQRFGFVVSKNHVKKIVQRNRVKRVLRAMVFRNLGRFPQGLDYIFQAKPGIGKIKTEGLKREMEEILANIETFKI